MFYLAQGTIRGRLRAFHVSAEMCGRTKNGDGLTRDAADGDEAALTVVLAADGVSGAVSSLGKYSSQHPDTSKTYQALPLPTPTALIGEQSTPTRTSGSRTRSSRPRIRLTTLLLAFSTWLQQWTGPVVQLPLPSDGVPDGVDRLASAGRHGDERET